MKYIIVLCLIVASILSYSQNVSEISYTYSGGMQYYSEDYNIEYGNSYISINDHGTETKRDFKVNRSEFDELGNQLKELGFYKVKVRESLDLSDAASYNVTIYNYGIRFHHHSLRDYTDEERDILKKCAELIKSFCEDHLK